MKSISLGDLNIYDIGNKYQIAGTIWTSAEDGFITLFPHKTKEDLHSEQLSILPMTLENWVEFLRQTDLLETEIFNSDPSGVIVKSIVRKTQRQIDSYLQWHCFRRDNYTCQYCGRTGIPLTVDHIWIWEDGGAANEENLLSACRSCNKDRGRIKYDDWINSDIYKRKSKNLPDGIKQKNIERISDLPRLKSLRVQNIRSR